MIGPIVTVTHEVDERRIGERVNKLHSGAERALEFSRSKHLILSIDNITPDGEGLPLMTSQLSCHAACSFRRRS